MAFRFCGAEKFLCQKNIVEKWFLCCVMQRSITILKSKKNPEYQKTISLISGRYLRSFLPPAWRIRSISADVKEPSPLLYLRNVA